MGKINDDLSIWVTIDLQKGDAISIILVLYISISIIPIL